MLVGSSHPTSMEVRPILEEIHGLLLIPQVPCVGTGANGRIMIKSGVRSLFYLVRYRCGGTLVRVDTQWSVCGTVLGNPNDDGGSRAIKKGTESCKAINGAAHRGS